MHYILFASSCKKDTFRSIKDAKLKVDFTTPANVSKIDMTKQTPQNYYVALKSVTLLGDEGTSDIEIFNESDLSFLFVFDLPIRKRYILYYREQLSLTETILP